MFTCNKLLYSQCLIGHYSIYPYIVEKFIWLKVRWENCHGWNLVCIFKVQEIVCFCLKKNFGSVYHVYGV